MPNTLAHIAVQTPLTRLFFRGARVEGVDLPWIYLGCVLPDLPWILQRGVKVLHPSADPYALRLYVVVQASLVITLVLCASVSVLAARPRRVMTILSLGAVLHLLADATQIKWANGVHLFAPFEWRPMRFDWFWPGHPVVWLITALGLLAIVLGWREATARPPELALSPRRVSLCALLVGVYLGAPLLGMGAAERADNHYVRTLREVEGRVGQPVELHSAHFFPAHSFPAHSSPVESPTNEQSSNGEEAFVLDLASQPLVIEGPILEDPALGERARVSIRGHFVEAHRVKVDQYRIQPQGRRDTASYLGLATIAAVWLAALRRREGPAPSPR